MTQIFVDATAADAIQNMSGPLEIVGPNGIHLGYVSRSHVADEPGFSKEEIAEMERRSASNGPWYSTEQVFAHLNSLERP